MKIYDLVVPPWLRNLQIMLQNINHRFRTSRRCSNCLNHKNSTTADWNSVRKYPEVMFFLSNSGWLKYKNHWRLVMFSESQLDPICADWKPTRSTQETNIPMDDSKNPGSPCLITKAYTPNITKLSKPSSRKDYQRWDWTRSMFLCRVIGMSENVLLPQFARAPGWIRIHTDMTRQRRQRIFSGDMGRFWSFLRVIGYNYVVLSQKFAGTLIVWQFVSYSAWGPPNSWGVPQLYNRNSGRGCGGVCGKSLG